MARLLVSLLGPFQVTLDGKPVTTFESAKARALLAFLATEAEHAHSRETLAELLWPERPPGAALADLRHALANLRKALSDATAQPPFLLITQTTLQFNTASDATIDVVDFVALLKHGSAATVADCQTALTMLHGPFLDGFKLSDSPQFEEWMVVTAEQVAHLARQASGRLADDCEEHGDYVQAAVWTRQQLALEPWNEEVHQRLIRQLASSGQRSVALHQYDICCRMLAVELGVEPQPATQALVAAIRDGDEELPPLAPQASGAQLGGRPPSSSASPRIGGRGADPSRPDHGRLPVQSSAFFGRDVELEQVATRLADPACRLLTVLGPGGMGKSRLAIQAAGALSEHFADGVWFVDLAPLNAPDQIAGAILRVFGLPPASPDSAAARLQEWLSGRQALLVLDNFEHLLAGANLLPVLLQATPALRLMVTSRARLHLADEWLLPLAGLETPAAPPSMGSTVTRFDHEPEDLSNVASVRLFLQQVQRLDPGYEPTPADLGQIGEICRLLEGMPLAIELAAAWIRTLALCEIAHAVYNRLELFAATLRDIPARHRSMHAVFDHSWRLLDERERSLLRQLAVFRGGWTLAAAETVAGTTFIELENLVDKSWLRLHDRRFSLHELMRQFCVAKLAEEHSAATGESSARVHQRHCAYFAGLTNAEDQALNWRREPMVLFNAEFGNLEAAWRWAIDQGELSAIRQMMIGLFFVAEMTGSCGAMLPYFEDAARELRSRRQNTELTSDQRKEAGLVLSTILYIQAILLFHVGRMAEARVCVNGMREIVATADPDIRWTEQEFLTRWATICLNLELGHFAEVDTAAPDLLTFVRTNDFPCYPWRPEIGTRFWQM
ncbi:MAG: winged helix-turn-helix domain-containing protein, partial [Caldilineaceae bacterium]|nr:winged helix-turn-helix domain-containing protein [Caldilineaceae bacterium]